MTKKRVLSFKYALNGIITALKDEPNLKIHFFLAILALILGFLFQISSSDWLVIIIAIGVVFSVEMTNTSIEELADSFTNEIHPSVKKAKDVAAGAVLVASITALLVGLIIFLPYFLNLMNSWLAF
jgi:undecaprenol kinase